MVDVGSQVVICGAGGHGRVVADIIEQLGTYGIAGFVDDDPSLQNRCAGGYPVLGGRESLRRLLGDGAVRCAMGIGDNAARRELASIALDLGCELITVIHPSAQVSARATIGAGSVVEACAVVKAGCRIGRLAIINSCVSVGHDVWLGEAVHISPGATIGGWARIGDVTHVGMGASLLPEVQIGDNVVVGANAVVIRDLPDNVVAAGVPARIIRENR